MPHTTTMTDIKSVLKGAPIFSSFAVKDVDTARTFYGSKLGLDVRMGKMGDLQIQGRTGESVFVYPKPDHKPAVFTVLNLQVRDIDEAVDGLIDAGIQLEQYNGENGIRTDSKGVARADKNGGNGPNIAWFRDPSGNIVAVMDGATR